ncbi:hypothetical protein F4677DRAFT_319564 [Hypoxylon crocopeplum]|nr:hypothetical protein F4677DRAFT_319564 [Hypoxylon crocopeplum]
MMQLKEAPRPILTPSGRIIPKVKIYHPEYPNNYSAMLQFDALDNDGVDYDLVYYACGILVGNNWPHNDEDRQRDPKAHYYLSSSTTPSTGLVQLPTGGILPKGTYYLHVPNSPQKPYPVTPGFSHWVFPHDKLPRPWRSLRIPAMSDEMVKNLPKQSCERTIIRDGCCRITHFHCGTEPIHIVPSVMAAWFIANGMEKYCFDQYTVPVIDDISNTILLRLDVHSVLDRKELILVPKLNDTKYELVTHVLSSQHHYATELETLYHNRTILSLCHVAPAFLFARFAWSIFNEATFKLFETQSAEFSVSIRESTEADEPVKIVKKTISSVSDIPPFPMASDKEAFLIPW